YNYYGCVQSEGNARIKAIWERFLEYELGQLRFVADLLEKHERRDAAEVLNEKITEPIRFVSHRQFVREVLRKEVDFRANGSEIVPKSALPARHRSEEFRNQLNRDGSPSDRVAQGYAWSPGTELARADNVRSAAAPAE